MSGDVAYGIEADPRDPWVLAASDLTLQRSLARIAANARFTVTTVAVVGTVLTSLGLVAATTVTKSEVSRGLALTAATSAALAVVLALCYTTVRLERLNVSDLEQVRLWYLRQFNRSWLPAVAGWLLVVSIVLGAVAGGVTVLSGPLAEPELSLSASGVGRGRTLSVQTVISGVKPGALVTVELTGVSNNGGTVVLFVNSTKIGEGGESSVRAEVPDPLALHSYRLSLQTPGHSSSLRLSSER